MDSATTPDGFEVDGTESILDIDLYENGDSSSTFRTENDPSAPYQRLNITQRRGEISIRCIGKEVIHGYLQDGQGPASLLVYDFQFNPRKSSRRVVSVNIDFVYGGGVIEPEVLKISPDGRMTLAPTTRTETITKGGELKAGATVLGAELGGGWKWERSINQDTKDATTVTGSVDLVHRNYGDANGASWTLLENASVKTGVPAFFRAAVLLKRSSFEEFHNSFKVNASADLIGSLKRFWGSTPKDDPIRYKPSLPPTNKLGTYDTNNLDSIDLDTISTASFANRTLAA
ncbi:hypothetical protein GQ53DRAFT_746093 [Thozetella sp. PMI_491]|nr:hypothetical protein GQ53DRAFT_746093 [Thozetella sp. PMI_491]